MFHLRSPLTLRMEPNIGCGSYKISPFLKKKYSRAYNGTNYKNFCWWQMDDETGLPFDPYKLLPPVFEELELSSDDNQEDYKIRGGGDALTAYAHMQFTDIDEDKREAIAKGLLRYCELDTLAMVMLWEHWRSLS